MNYLTRPIFQFEIDWSDPVNKQFTYDLKELSLGFGAEIFNSLQAHTAQGYQFNVNLPTPAEIAALDDFTAAVAGRLAGFWLPAPFDALRAVARVSDTQFDIIWEDLSGTWNTHPDIHLYFTRDGYAPQAAKITAVADLDNGYERVTIDTALADSAVLFTTAASARRLHYVRLAEDVEQATFVAEGWQTRPMKVVELPLEYTEAETGQKPIYLYTFECGAPMDLTWRYTSFAADVVSNNETFHAGTITHGALLRSVKADPETLEIDTAYDANHPLALFLPIPFPRLMTVTVLQTTPGDPDTTRLIFTGQVRSVADKGEQLTAGCESFFAVYERKVPRMMVQPNCNYQVYEPRTCKILRARFETTALVDAVHSAGLPPDVEVTLSFPTDDRKADDWFAQGFLETGEDASFEVRTIIASSFDAGTGRVTLRLNAPLVHAVNGQGLQLIPGCDGAAATCRDKFKNFTNFGGFVAVPKQNPSMVSIASNTAAGGKK